MRKSNGAVKRGKLFYGFAACKLQRFKRKNCFNGIGAGNNGVYRRSTGFGSVNIFLQGANGICQRGSIFICNTTFGSYAGKF